MQGLLRSREINEESSRDVILHALTAAYEIWRASDHQFAAFMFPVHLSLLLRTEMQYSSEIRSLCFGLMKSSKQFQTLWAQLLCYPSMSFSLHMVNFFLIYWIKMALVSGRFSFLLVANDAYKLAIGFLPEDPVTLYHPRLGIHATFI